MLQLFAPFGVSSTRLWHRRRCVSAPFRLTNWHFLPLNLVITTPTRRSPAQPRSFELPLALMPFLRDTRSFLRAIELCGASLSVQPPVLLPPPPLLVPPPPLLVPPPPAPGAPRSTSATRPTLALLSVGAPSTARTAT